METNTVPVNYDANVLVTYKDITNGEVSYPVIKVNDLEWQLEEKKSIMKRIEQKEMQIGKILNRLNEEFWFGRDYDKNEVLQELCEILEHRPVRTVEFRGTMSFEGTVEVPLESAEDFDLYYHLQDNLQLETYDVDIDINTYQVEEAEER